MHESRCSGLCCVVFSIALHEEDWPTAQAWSVIGHACRDYGAELRTAAVHCVDRGLEVDTNSKRVHDLRRALDEDARIASEGESVQEGLERDSGSAQLRGGIITGAAVAYSCRRSLDFDRQFVDVVRHPLSLS